MDMLAGKITRWAQETLEDPKRPRGRLREHWIIRFKDDLRINNIKEDLTFGRKQGVMTNLKAWFSHSRSSRFKISKTTHTTMYEHF